MAAKIRAMELLPRAFDTEYLKLYGVVFAGWALTAVGTSLFFGGFPFLGGGVGAGLLGIVTGSVFWIPGGFVLLGGLVATVRKVILETTNDEFVKIDRAVDGESAAGSNGESTDSLSRETPVHAGSRPDDPGRVESTSRIQDPADSQADASNDGEADADSDSSNDGETDETSTSKE